MYGRKIIKIARLGTKLVAVFLLLGLVACAKQNALMATSKSVQTLDSSTFLFENSTRFGARPNISEPTSLFLLSDQQREDFSLWLAHPARAQSPAHRNVYDYLEQSTYRFNYLGRTHIASQALGQEEGNCLSLAILTTALARLAKVEVRYQLVDSSPIFEQGEIAIAKGVHIRSKLYSRGDGLDSEPGHSWLARSGLIVDYFPGDTSRFIGNLSEHQFVARYYRNIAVEYLQSGDFNNSYWYTIKSFEYAPNDAEGVNLLAVIFKQLGEIAQAERIYRFGIRISDDKLTLFKNYRQLLREQNRTNDATQIDKEIAKLDDPSPYKWLSLGHASYQSERYRQASRYYKKSIALAPYLQFGYLGLAKTYYQQGEIDNAESMLRMAMERNYSRGNDRLYEAKLAALTKDKNTH